MISNDILEITVCPLEQSTTCPIINHDLFLIPNTKPGRLDGCACMCATEKSRTSKSMRLVCSHNITRQFRSVIAHIQNPMDEFPYEVHIST